MHINGFKTERSTLIENSRHPRLVRRVGSLLWPSKSQTPSKFSGKMKGLLEDSKLSEEEKKKLKIAFTEGYMVRDSQFNPKWLLKWIQLISVIIISHLLILYIIANVSDSMLHIQKTQSEVGAEEINITFNDVKGAAEAKEELKDVVEFLRNPKKFNNLGAKLPKGVLLVGPPGTGKTLLARAVAGEADVPFFHVAGPEFDEILVGQGARRIRDLFKAAKEKAPSVIFIDEIDSVGAKRTNSVLHPYANQTINQLLTEMDGFRQSSDVIVLGATNRKEDLDKALLRPGRFDIEVHVPIPDLADRREILSLYLSRIRSDKHIDVDVLARGTTGFTGADLDSMVNQAALKAAIEGAPSVGMKHLEHARDKVLMGPERKRRIPDEEANQITAYHESGHAVVAYFTKEASPLHKVTIIPRGQSLGHTAYIPDKERYHVTKCQLVAMMDTMMGGRAAEELIFGTDKITSGASSDLRQATSIATRMVKEWGMSDKAGLRTFDSNESQQTIVVQELSHQTIDHIDTEIQRLLQESYNRAKAILKTHRMEHKLLAEALLKYETLDAESIKAIMKLASQTD